MRRRQGGFSLIELLVVVGVIIVLAGLALGAVNIYRSFAKARNAHRKVDVANLHAAARLYAVKNTITTPPLDRIGWIPRNIGTGTKKWMVDLTPFVGDYIEPMRTDPLGGTLENTQYSLRRDVNGCFTVMANNSELGEHQWEGCGPNYYLSFDGVDDLAQMPGSSDLNPGIASQTGAMTISAWVRYRTLTPRSLFLAKETSDAAGTTHSAYALGQRLYGPTGTHHFLATIRGGEIFGKSNHPKVVAHEWYNVVITGSAGRGCSVPPGVAALSSLCVSLYIDGNYVDHDTWNTPLDTAAPLFIGRSGDFADPSQIFPSHADVDDVRVYNRVLTPEEIKHIAEGLFPQLDDASLVGWWTFDDGAGTKVSDTKSNPLGRPRFDGTLKNGIANSPPADGVTTGPKWRIGW